MKEATELFIGGASDGRRISFPECLPIIRLPLPGNMQQSFYKLEVEEYRRERLATQNRCFEYYVSQSISTEAALVRLFNHYRPNDK